MPKWTVLYSVLLILLGLFGYFVWGQQQSWTALIPAFAGILFLICGLLAHKESIRKHVMHVACALALLFFFGTARGLMGLAKLVQGEEVARPLAVKVQSASALLTIIFLILCIRSFVLARFKKS